MSSTACAALRYCYPAHPNKEEETKMNLALWIVQAVLALIFLGAGTVKLVQSRDRLVKTLGGWVEDVPAGLIKAIGALEILAAIGLILPPALGIFPVLAPLAAAGLVAVMVGAIITHARRGEYSSVVVNVVLAALAIFRAWGRFGPYRF